MRKFKKKAEFHFLVLPECGRVVHQILEGDAYAKYVPSLLEEVIPEKKFSEDEKQALLAKAIRAQAKEEEAKKAEALDRIQEVIDEHTPEIMERVCDAIVFGTTELEVDPGALETMGAAQDVVESKIQEEIETNRKPLVPVRKLLKSKREVKQLERDQQGYIIIDNPKAVQVGELLPKAYQKKPGKDKVFVIEDRALSPLSTHEAPYTSVRDLKLPKAKAK